MSKTVVEREFWSDELIVDEYSPEDKLFMLYLLTCPKGNSIGIYKIPIKLMAFEIGYSPETARTLIDRFMNRFERIRYDYKSQEIAILSSMKYTINSGGKPMEDMISREIEEVSETENLVAVYENMRDFWLRSERAIDKFIMTLFEKEINKRKAISDISNNTNNNIYTYTNTYTYTYTDTDNLSYNDTSNESSDDTYKLSAEDKQSIMNAWNDLNSNIPRLKALTPSSNRYKSLRTRIAEYGLDSIITAINNINDSRFLQGDSESRPGNKKSFVITFDWFIEPNNFIKVLEGNYKDKKTRNNKAKKSGKGLAELARQRRLERLKES